MSVCTFIISLREIPGRGDIRVRGQPWTRAYARCWETGKRNKWLGPYLSIAQSSWGDEIHKREKEIPINKPIPPSSSSLGIYFMHTCCIIVKANNLNVMQLRSWVNIYHYDTNMDPSPGKTKKARHKMMFPILFVYL